MKNLCKKLIAIVITVAMMASFAVTSSFASAELEITSLAQIARACAGKTVSVDVSAIPAGAEKVVVSANGASVSEAAVSDNSASADVVLAYGDNKFTVDAVDANGNVLASGTITLSGCKEEVYTNFCDVDFEDDYSTVVANDGITVSLTKGGTATGIGLHLGKPTNEIVVEANPETPEFGKSLHMISNDASANLQANNVWANTSDRFVVYEYDYYAENLNRMHGVSALALYPAGKTSYDWSAGGLTANTNGTFAVTKSGKTVVVGECEVGKWYHIARVVDLAEDITYLYIDNKLVDAQPIGFDAERSGKILFDISPTKDSEDTTAYYIDNINLYSAYISAPGVDIVNENAGDVVVEGQVSTITGMITDVDADSVIVYVNGEVYAIIDSVADGKFTAEIVATEGTSDVWVEAYKGDDLIATSNTVEVSGYVEEVTKTLHNIDFETQTLNTAGLPAITVCNSSGSSLGLTAHVGVSKTNTITIANRADNNGKAINLKALCNEEVQFNEFTARLSDNNVKIEYDYMAESLAFASNTRIDVMDVVMLSTSGGNVWPGPYIYMQEVNGKPTFCNSNSSYTVSYPAELGEWYKITAYVDRTKGKIDYYIDGKYFTTATFDKSAVASTSKIVTKIANGNGTSVWVDNFKVQAVEIAEPIPTVVTYVNGYSEGIPAGSVVELNAKTLCMPAASTLKVINTTTGETVDTINSNEGSVRITLAEGVYKYKVQALDANGSVIKESDELELIGYHEIKAATIWDLDFEGVTTATNDVSVAFYQGPTTLKGLNAHIGSATSGNSITVGKTGIENDVNGDSIILHSATKDNCQLNNFAASVTSDIAVVSIDFAISDYAALQAMGIAGNTWCFPVIYTDAAGNFLVGTTKVSKYEPNKWYNLKYNIDITNGIVRIYVDNSLVYENTSDSYKAATVRLAVANGSSAAGKTTYVDNFKAYRAIYERPIPAVNVNYNTYNNSLPAGAIIPVNADVSYAPSTASLRLYRVFDGVTEAVAAGKEAKFYVELKPWAMQYKIQALDAAGEVVAESDAINLTGNNTVVSQQVWDEDFTGASTAANGVSITVTRDGSPIKSNGNGLYANTGNADNTITVENSASIEGGINGDAVRLNTINSAAQCQINTFETTISSGIAVISADIAVDSHGARQLFGVVCKNGTWLSTVSGTADGKISVGGNTVALELNKWYNIKYIMDIANGIVDIYVDNVHMYRQTGVASGSYPYRVSITNKAVVGSTWVDNFNTACVAYDNTAFDLTIADAEFIIDGETASAMANGDLAVSAVVTNDGTEAVATLAVAVYEGNVLKNVKIEKLAFESGKAAIGKFVDLGAVTSAQTAKIMLIGGESGVAPLCAPVVLK